MTIEKESTVQKTLKTFFEEKQLEDRIYTVDHGSKTHVVESGFVINLILNHTSEGEKEQIWPILSKLDFRNGNIHHFLEHLAKGYVVTNFDTEGNPIAAACRPQKGNDPLPQIARNRPKGSVTGCFASHFGLDFGGLPFGNPRKDSP